MLLRIYLTLDDIFKLPHKTTLSQRDVPGMTRGVVPLLQKRGVNGITVGVNGGVCPAQVPMLFRWQTIFFVNRLFQKSKKRTQEHNVVVSCNREKSVK